MVIYFTSYCYYIRLNKSLKLSLRKDHGGSKINPKLSDLLKKPLALILVSILSEGLKNTKRNLSFVVTSSVANG